jgi:hypothetical protein
MARVPSFKCHYTFAIFEKLIRRQIFFNPAFGFVKTPSTRRNITPQTAGKGMASDSYGQKEVLLFESLIYRNLKSCRSERHFRAMITSMPKNITGTVERLVSACQIR